MPANRSNGFAFRPYQVEAGRQLSEILLSKRFALDGSDTGVGKTFTAIAALTEFESAPVAVICRARAQTKWREALALFEITPLFIMSWDKARGTNEWFRPIMTQRGKFSTFSLRLSEPTLIVIDEIHAGGAIKSKNAEVVIACRRCPDAYVLGLSATVTDTPLKMRAIGFCCGLHTLGEDYWLWCRRNGCGKSPFGGLYFRKRDRERVLGKLHRMLFNSEDSWGVRLRRKELADAGQFPACETFVELWDVPSKLPGWLMLLEDEIRDDEIRDEEKHEGETPAIVRAIRERQRAELYKVPALIEEIEDQVEEGSWVIVFVQFTRTLHAIASKLKQNFAVVAGSWPGKRADEEAEKFQSGKVQIILCQIDAGSESIDLHDTDGSRPRHVILFPTYKAVTLIQALGRAPRSGGKSPVVQRLIYSAGGIEEKIAKVVERKLENLNMIADGELTAGGMI